MYFLQIFNELEEKPMLELCSFRNNLILKIALSQLRKHKTGLGQCMLEKVMAGSCEKFH
jgi:hypothetical protein